jgi:hypothetical protein
METIEIPNDHKFTSVSVNGEIVENLKPIKVDNYWVVVDIKAEILAKDFILFWSGQNYHILQLKDNELPYNHTGSGFKIIASTKFIDKYIPVIKFVEESVEEIALTLYPIELHNSIDINKVKRENFIKYNKFSKSYTEEDLENAIIMAFDIAEYGILNFERDKYKNKIIQSLNQPKLPDVINLEMEEIPFVQVSWETDEMFELRKKYGEKILKLKTKSTLEGEVIEIKI